MIDNWAATFDDWGLLPPRNVWTPRPYQIDAERLGLAELALNGKCLLIGATGTGKTEIIARLTQNCLREHQEGGVLIVTPQTVLVGQTVDKLRSRGVDCDVEQGPLRGSGKVTVASYQSLIRDSRWKRFVGQCKLVMVDEVHVNYTKASLAVLDDLCKGGAKLVGLTASPNRMSGDPITKFYGNVAWNYPVERATEDGYLVPSQLWLTVAKHWDFSRFASAMGDYDAKQLDEILRTEESVQLVWQMVKKHYDNLQSVVFCHSIHHAETLVKIAARDGVAMSVVHSRQPIDERRENLEDFESGRISIIANVGCLTLGWDYPHCQNLFLAKPTKSQTKYLQMYGRLTRPLPGVIDGLHTPEARKAAIAASAKPFFSVFDLTDSSRHCELMSAIDLLCPNLPPNIMLRTKKKLEGRAGATSKEELDAIIEEEIRADAKARAAQDKLDEYRRKNLIVDTDFSCISRDPYAPAETTERMRGWRMLFGKHKGMPLAAVPTGYLQWIVRESNCRNRLFLAACATEVGKRAGKNPR